MEQRDRVAGALERFESNIVAVESNVFGKQRRRPPTEVVADWLAELVDSCHGVNLLCAVDPAPIPRFQTMGAGGQASPRFPVTLRSMTHIDLSHDITNGMITYPGLPAPVIGSHLTRDAAEEIYGPGITFQIGLIEICTNTGTYLDVPFHRFADGHDLTGLSLDRVAGVGAVCLDRVGETSIELQAEQLVGLSGMAVLVRTDHSQHFGTDAYMNDHPHLTQRSAALLVEAGVACVGIDSLNIDSTEGGERPVHTTLLGAEIPIIEHLNDLALLPSTGFAFTAVPPKIEGAGTFTVRAFATV